MLDITSFITFCQIDYAMGFHYFLILKYRCYYIEIFNISHLYSQKNYVLGVAFLTLNHVA
ncbi:hypothetical protein HMP0015_0337 [Acinetobacter haemolyticus ATCC 19194]|uniref:Uncharacterized protein n=1 Tax=Acinetobacter haemolyticus ATCC 19194 TaxID=707232 RepID=D4XKU5_ACIHA|nr:hypothetical protein HMP0015_0337 [Acinetobacter haemolyticus ATCC 19194]